MSDDTRPNAEVRPGEIALLYYLQGRSAGEIATKLGLSVSQVETTLALQEKEKSIIRDLIPVLDEIFGDDYASNLEGANE